MPARQGDLLHFDHNEYPTSNDVTSMFNSMSIIAPHPPAPHAAQAPAVDRSVKPTGALLTCLKCFELKLKCFEKKSNEVKY